jgi:hypothetical protein
LKNTSAIFSNSGIQVLSEEYTFFKFSLIFKLL